jgi:hypothetical protein
MSDLFGFMTDDLGGGDEALALASYARGGSGGGISQWGNIYSSGVGKNAGNPLLKRSKQYYSIRLPGQIVGLDNQSDTRNILIYTARSMCLIF